MDKECNRELNEILLIINIIPPRMNRYYFDIYNCKKCPKSDKKNKDYIYSKKYHICWPKDKYTKRQIKWIKEYLSEIDYHKAYYPIYNL